LNALMQSARSALLQCGLWRNDAVLLCALSGGCDSVALLHTLCRLQRETPFSLHAVHVQHGLRGEESLADERFVRELCRSLKVPLTVENAGLTGDMHTPGMETLARESRRRIFEKQLCTNRADALLTAHHLDDQAETVLMHLLRGTGLKGLGGIMPINGNVIRPMLSVTREEVEAFLEEWCLPHIEDSSNDTDAFLRNRLRHHVMPLLRQENPKIAKNLSRMALHLRQDEECLSTQAEYLAQTPAVSFLRQAHPAVRSRYLVKFLKDSGVKEPEDSHIALAEALVFSENPSARANFPGGVTIIRRYDQLEVLTGGGGMETVELPCPGQVELPGLRVSCAPATELLQTPDTITVCPSGKIVLRSRLSGDTIRLAGGTKSLKKLFIDRKIPASHRPEIPVVSDEQGILGVYGIGVNLDRAADTLPAAQIRFEKIT